VSDREFLEKVETTLRELAERELHNSGTTQGGVCLGPLCERCRLEQLADEAADRAARAA
jgi:hypothetical protein